MEDLKPPGPRSIDTDETIELVCGSGHRTMHLLARILRLNDGWCGKCGADLNYEPLERVDAAPANCTSARHMNLVPAETMPA